MSISIGNVLLEKSIKVFLNLLDSNTTNVVKDIFIISTEDIPGRKKDSSVFEKIKNKKFRILTPDKC